VAAVVGLSWGNEAPNLGSEKLWRSRFQQLWATGRLKRVS